MIKPTKQAYLRHDLFKVVLPQGLTNSAYTTEEIAEAMSKITYTKIASKGMKFVWCETESDPSGRLIPMNMGWFADAGSGLFGNGLFVAGNYGFGQMTWEWGKKHLTEPEPYQHTQKDSDDDFWSTLKQAKESMNAVLDGNVPKHKG